MTFIDRRDGGRVLAGHLVEFANRTDVVVLALPRGGVPVGAEVARALVAPFDVFLVRKLGVPGHEELAMGAIAEGGIQVLNESLIAELGISRQRVAETAARERLELERRDALYRGGRRAPVVENRTVILVDDGLATGATMEAAVLALRQHKAAAVVVAAPVGAPETCARLARIADRVVCPEQPPNFYAVGAWYRDFTQTSDRDVKDILAAEGRMRLETNPTHRPADPVAIVRRRVLPLEGGPSDFDALVEAVGGARAVLMGEATHGTHDFYRVRALITRRLIAEKGFGAVAVEADWPDAYRINRFVRGAGADHDAIESLADFERFPTWMWRNTDVLEFVGWLREFNDARRPEERAGFYGLDLYSLHASMRAVVAYLDKADPEAAARARQRYACFDRFGGAAEDYAYGTGSALSASCERDVLDQLVDLRTHAADYMTRDHRLLPDDYFFAEQNARIVRNAEEYYRTMFGGRVESWNLRDRHMDDTLGRLLDFLDRPDAPAKVVVWAHNSHVGDARATEMGEGGELNVGQLARARFDAACQLIGFSTYAGSVTAASGWDGPAERKHVRPALAGSYERLFHEVGVAKFLVPMRTDLELSSVLAAPRLERAIGVLYLPGSERRSHYFHARLADQFDFVLHYDETRAVEPLERTGKWDAGELAETYPSGL